MKVAAAAALGDMPIFTGTAFADLGVKFGVKAGDSTLRFFFGLHWFSLALIPVHSRILTR